jgi:hypothetical protein
VLAASIIRALMMDAASTSETLVNFYQTTWNYNPEDSHPLTSCGPDVSKVISDTPTFGAEIASACSIMFLLSYKFMHRTWKSSWKRRKRQDRNYSWRKYSVTPKSRSWRKIMHSVKIQTRR